MILIKRMAVGLLAGLTVGVTTAKAQYAQPQWGTGVWGGQQPCPYPVQVANGAQSYLDEYRAVQKNLSLEQDTLERLEAKQRELSDLIEDAQEVINGTIDAKYADFIIEHASNQRSCSEYQRTGRAPPAPAPAPAPQPVSERPPAPTAGLPAPPPGAADAGEDEPETDKERRRRLREEAERKKRNEKGPSDKAMVTQSRSIANVDGQEGGGANDDLIPITGFTEQQWFSNCISRSKGAVNSRVCSTRPFNSVRKRSGTDAECKLALLHITNGYEDLQKVEAQIASTQRKISRLEDQVDRTAKSAVRRARTQTESGFCAMCEEYARANRERAQWGSLATAGVGALLHFSERRDNKNNAKNDCSI